MSKKKLNSKGKKIFTLFIILGIIYMGLIRLYGENMGIKPEFGGIVSFGGLVAILVIGKAIAGKNDGFINNDSEAT